MILSILESRTKEERKRERERDFSRVQVYLRVCAWKIADMKRMRARERMREKEVGKCCRWKLWCRFVDESSKDGKISFLERRKMEKSLSWKIGDRGFFDGSIRRGNDVFERHLHTELNEGMHTTYTHVWWHVTRNTDAKDTRWKTHTRGTHVHDYQCLECWDLFK